MDEATRTLIGKRVGFAGRLLSCDRRLASRLVKRAGGLVARGGSADVVVVGDGVRLPSQGRVRTLTESQFLSLVRPVELDGADTVGRLVSAAEVARMFPHLTWARRRSLAKQGLIRPVQLPNGMGFSFADLRVMRQVDELLADGVGLSQAVARLVPRLAGQLELRFPRARFSPRPRTADLGGPPSTAEAWFEIGACADRDRAGFPTAIAAYLRALEIDRDHVPSLINLGNVHYEIGEFGRARDLYARAARVDPENPRTHFNLGNACDELSDLLGALRAYRRAITLWPGYADAHFNLALVAEKLDSWTLARRHWRRFLELEPRSEWAAVAKSHLEDATARAGRTGSEPAARDESRG
ncbi:tetratricopeptide repeat protein [bacterium]|nr:tetratricopeptide repeat protein [bacterium]